MSEYKFKESAGSLPESVYIVRENLVTVSSNFTVTIIIQTTSTADPGIEISEIISRTVFVSCKGFSLCYVSDNVCAEPHNTEPI